MIVKEGKKWVIKSETGRNLGAYDTKKEASDRLQQIEYLKNKKQTSEKSDRRIKQNIVDLPDGLPKILSLIPRQFEFVYSPGYSEVGFIAQEYFQTFPNYTQVNGDDGEIPLTSLPPWEITTDVLFPYLVSAIKELSARVEALENP